MAILAGHPLSHRMGLYARTSTGGDAQCTRLPSTTIGLPMEYSKIRPDSSLIATDPDLFPAPNWTRTPVRYRTSALIGRTGKNAGAIPGGNATSAGAPETWDKNRANTTNAPTIQVA